MIDSGDSQVILKWSKNHQENHYLKIAILWVDMASAVAVASLNDLKIHLWTTLSLWFKKEGVEGMYMEGWGTGSIKPPTLTHRPKNNRERTIGGID